MRRKYLARLRRGPANCNHQDPDASSLARGGGSSLGQAEIHCDYERDRKHRFGGPGWDYGALRRKATARRHRARLMWVLARELCASAALYGISGRGAAKIHTLRLAFKVLRDRARFR